MDRRGRNNTARDLLHTIMSTPQQDNVLHTCDIQHLGQIIRSIPQKPEYQQGQRQKSKKGVEGAQKHRRR